MLDEEVGQAFARVGHGSPQREVRVRLAILAANPDSPVAVDDPRYIATVAGLKLREFSFFGLRQGASPLRPQPSGQGQG